MTNNTVFFLMVAFAIIISAALLLKRNIRNSRYLSNSIFIALVISIISTISLAVNYMAAFTGKLDGISLTGWLAKLIIGEGRWSIEMFYGYYEAATAISVFILSIYFVALLYEKRRYNS